SLTWTCRWLPAALPKRSNLSLRPSWNLSRQRPATPHPTATTRKTRICQATKKSSMQMIAKRMSATWMAWAKTTPLTATTATTTMTLSMTDLETPSDESALV
ncbi:hypothetical protein GGH91_003373, partial [Coemansia sp. RSA 2671]